MAEDNIRRSKRLKMERNFPDLPVELMIEVFGYFPSTVELKFLSTICKLWRDVIEDRFKLSEKFELQCDGNRIEKNDIKNFPRNYKRMAIAPQNYDIAMKITKRCDIKHLRVDGVTQKTYKIIEHLKNKLISLEISHSDNGSELEDFCLIPNLTEIKIDITNYREFKFLKKLLISNSKTIRKLEICFDEVLSVDYDFTFLDDLINLTTFSFHVPEVSCFGNHRTSLRSMYLKRYFGKVFGGLRSVETMKLSGFHIPGEMLSNIKSLFPRIKDLQLDSIENSIFSIASKQIPSLTSLQCMRRASVPTHPIINFTASLTCFSLDLQLCSKELLTVFIRQCPLIKEFKVSEVNADLNAPLLLQIAVGWPKLTTLSFDHGTEFNIIKWRFTSTTESAPIKFPQVKKLTIEGCQNLKFFFAMAEIPNLLQLYLHSSSWDDSDNEEDPVRSKICNKLKTFHCIDYTAPFLNETFPQLIDLKFQRTEIVTGFEFLNNIESKTYKGMLYLNQLTEENGTEASYEKCLKKLDKVTKIHKWKLYNSFDGITCCNYMKDGRAVSISFNPNRNYYYDSDDTTVSGFNSDGSSSDNE